MTPVGLLPAGVALLGLALLEGRIATAFWTSLRLAAAIAVWGLIWRISGGWIATSALLTDLAATPQTALILNAALALVCALPPALALWLTARPGALGGLHGMVWCGVLILPQLGREGTWPPVSVALALICAGLALLLGRLSQDKHG
ncbi:MAG: hypothetical protein AAGF79_06100 [Pseudomonadota bacterium]